MDSSTIVVFTSSCGPDLVRDKGTLYDPGIALPLAIRWPGRIPAGTEVDNLCSSTDFLPTILETIESDAPFEMQGKSVATAMLGGQQSGPNDCVFGIHTDSRYVRTKDFKLIVNLTPTAQYASPPVDMAHVPEKEPVPPFELYNLKADPDETVNIVTKPEHTQTVKTLRLKLAAWMEKVGDPILRKVCPTDYFKKAIATLMAK